MGKLILLCILIAIGYFGYTKFFGPQARDSSEAIATYNKFADAMARNQYSQAKPFTSGAALAAVESEESTMTKNLVINPYAGSKEIANEARKEAGLAPLNDKQVTGVSMMNEMAGPVASTKFEVTKEQASGNSINLEVKGSVCRTQPGCMGARCTHCSQSQHTVEMCKASGSWSVCSFQVTPLN